MVLKTLSYASFAIACLFVVLLFITAKSYTQLGIAIVIYPLFAYYALKIFPRVKNEKQKIQSLKTGDYNDNKDYKIKKTENVVDLDKRTFLKLVGATGLSFFLFSLLGRKTETILFGESLESRLISIEKSIARESSQTTAEPNYEGNQNYKISEIVNGLDATYYGFVNDKGWWFIMKEEAETGSFRYVRGKKQFPENWERRENLNYNYYHQVFGDEN